INDDDLEEMDLKWPVAMISIRIKKFHMRIELKGINIVEEEMVGIMETKLKTMINDDDLEEMDLKWPVAMISIRIKKFHMRIGILLDCRAKGNQYSRRRDGGYNGNKAKDNGRRPAYQDESKALVTIKGEAID
nr:hypothetical protein [Tanacetum cinerariifolium]